MDALDKKIHPSNHDPAASNKSCGVHASMNAVIYGSPGYAAGNSIKRSMHG